MYKAVNYYFLVLILKFSISFAQQNQFDSLLKLSGSGSHDTIRLGALVELTEICEVNDIIKFAQPAVELADKLEKNRSINTSRVLLMKAIALNNIGYLYLQQGDVPNGLEYYEKSLSIKEKHGDKLSIAGSVNNIAYVYQQQGNISKALEFHNRSQKLYEEAGYKPGLAVTLTNLGSLYHSQVDYPKALEYWNRALEMQKELVDSVGIAISLNNIGSIYIKQNNMTKALDYSLQSYNIREKLNDKQGMAWSLNNIGKLYQNKGSLDTALSFFYKSLELKKILRDKKGIAITFDNIGKCYLLKKNNSLAIRFADSSLTLSKQLGFPEEISNSEQLLSEVYTNMNNYAEAFTHYKNYIFYRDSINNDQTRKAGMRSQLNYEFEKKAAVLEEQQEKERAIAAEKHSRQQMMLWLSAAVIVLVIGFAVYVFRSLKMTKQQKYLIERKQKEILDSIHYALRIQKSLLPREKSIDKAIDRLQKMKKI